MVAFLDRYLAGEHERVWNELTALGDQVRQEKHRPDASAVAQETMRRVKVNLQTLIPRLTALGWRFGVARTDQEDYEGVWTPPPPDASARVEAMESVCGPIPLSLRAFYEIVGGVDLRGAHPDWPGIYDPLLVASCQKVLENLHATREWREQRAREGKPVPPFSLYYAPDFLVKEGISGVGALYVEGPNGAADAPLSFEDSPLPIMFVQSLHNAFR
ncbi:MAG: hypothetical protein JO250_18600 [Armatimonadetes bacterium]|nr:hypothetical protein [Armatimonadota bacterium]